MFVKNGKTYVITKKGVNGNKHYFLKWGKKDTSEDNGGDTEKQLTYYCYQVSLNGQVGGYMYAKDTNFTAGTTKKLYYTTEMGFLGGGSLVSNSNELLYSGDLNVYTVNNGIITLQLTGTIYLYPTLTRYEDGDLYE